LPEEDRRQAEFYANLRNYLVTFTLNGAPGFIERLPRYRRKINALKRGRLARAITAVMVGPAHVQSVSFQDYERLFPLDVLALLTLATGMPVGSPWIEFRDEHGQLVRRVHISFGNASFKTGHPALSVIGQNAIGYLLTCAFNSAETGQPYLRAATNQVIDAAMKMTALESRFLSLCRALETLFQHHGLGADNLVAGLELVQQDGVSAALEKAERDIRVLLTNEHDPARRAAIERIASRARSAGSRENHFGLSILALLSRFGFRDAHMGVDGSTSRLHSDLGCYGRYSQNSPQRDGGNPRPDQRGQLRHLTVWARHGQHPRWAATALPRKWSAMRHDP